MNKNWVVIFKALGNANRCKIIEMLYHGKSLSVTEISEELGISLKSTSKHLIQLENLKFLESSGKKGHVFYALNKNLPLHIKQALKLFC